MVLVVLAELVLKKPATVVAGVSHSLPVDMVLERIRTLIMNAIFAQPAGGGCLRWRACMSEESLFLPESDACSKSNTSSLTVEDSCPGTGGDSDSAYQDGTNILGE